MKSISICACDVGIFYTCNAVGNACLHKASSRLFFIRFVLKCWWIIFPCFNQKKKKKQTNRRNRFILESNDCFVCFELFIWSGYFKIAISRIADCWVSLRGRQELMLVAGGWPDIPAKSMTKTKQKMSYCRITFNTFQNKHFIQNAFF